MDQHVTGQITFPLTTVLTLRATERPLIAMNQHVTLQPISSRANGFTLRTGVNIIYVLCQRVISLAAELTVRASEQLFFGVRHLDVLF